MLIVPPPKGRSIFSKSAEDLQKLVSNSGHPSVQEVLRKANETYVHWHRFRHFPIPMGISNEDAWLLIKLSRRGNTKHLPLLDSEGKPFEYWVPDGMMRDLNAVDLWAGGNIVSDHAEPLASREQYVIRSLMDEAIASSQLEGADTTRKAAKELLRTGRKPRDVGEQMILNNWETIQFIRENKAVTLTPEFVSEIHARITHGTLADPKESGQFRNRDDIVVEYRTQVVHVPPKATTLPDRMERLCKFVNTEQEPSWIHPVLKGAIIHFWLAYDHPFTDGNGRTARALMYWFLLSRGYLLFEYLSISQYIHRAPGRYVRAYLYSETDDNDLTYFLSYNLRAIRQACNDAKEYITRKQNELARANALLKTYRGLNHRQKMLIYDALQHPHGVYDISAHKNYHGIVYETARKDLLGLWRKGFLERERHGKEFLFIRAEKMIDKLRSAQK